jgi:GDPmannose 4,6-dehydratase
VREFCEVTFAHIGLPVHWQGQGEQEKGVGPDGRTLIEVDPKYFRPAEVDLLLGDASKARKELGWQPRVGFAELARMMVDADLT